MFHEDDLLPISALQHLLFCERQCALIHVEGLWAENRLTVEGAHLHRKAHEEPGETRPGVRVTRGLPLRSFRLGLIGKADVVEFRGTPAIPYPIEYKRGRPKGHRADEVQLCAQALCLEEMLGATVAEGALFYAATRRRRGVALDPELRMLTEAAAGRLRQLIVSGRTPPAVREPKCDACSLFDLCLPGAASGRRSVAAYVARAVGLATADAGPER